MGRWIKDEELRAYADKIGHEEYRRSYQHLLTYAHVCQNVRFSGAKNKSIDLEKIKEKYKNGVTTDILNEMFNS